MMKTQIKNITVKIIDSVIFILTALRVKLAGYTANDVILRNHIINVLDPVIVKDYLGTSDGEKTILKLIKRNKDSLGRFIKD